MGTKNRKENFTPEQWAEYLKRSRERKQERRQSDPAYAERKRELERKLRQRKRATDTAYVERMKEWKRNYRLNNPAYAVKEKERGLRRRGFSTSLVDVLMTVQGGGCAVCGCDMPTVQSANADHCHDTNTPRGLLCTNCNLAEGFIKKTGLCPQDFGARLQKYLDAPPAEIASAALELAG